MEILGHKRESNKKRNLQIMGDCGAFTYADQQEPPYSVDEVINFYEGLNLDFGVSMDHIIFDYLDLIGSLLKMAYACHLYTWL